MKKQFQNKYVFKKKINILIVSLIDFLGSLVRYLFIRDKLSENITKILVVRLDHLGDVIFATPIFSGLRKKFPQAKITVLVSHWSKEVIEFNPDIDKVIIFDAPWFTRNKVNLLINIKQIIKVIHWLVKEKFDLGIELRGDLRNIVLLFLGGVKYKIGYGITGGGFLLSRAVEYVAKKHEIEHNLDIIKSIGITVDEPKLMIPIDDESRDYITKVLNNEQVKENDLIVVLHPGAGYNTKCWGNEKFGKLIMYIDKEYAAKIIIVGGNSEIEKFRNDFLGIQNKIINLVGKTSLLQLGALLERAQLFIGGDSAPAHIAATVRTPSVIIFSGTNNPDQWCPWNPNATIIQKKVDCMYCEKKECPDLRCLKLITVEEVREKVKDIIEKGKK